MLIMNFSIESLSQRISRIQCSSWMVIQLSGFNDNYGCKNVSVVHYASKNSQVVSGYYRSKNIMITKSRLKRLYLLLGGNLHNVNEGYM